MTATFTELLRKAQDAFLNFRAGSDIFLGKTGEVIYSKNNICVHEDLSSQPQRQRNDDRVIHTPGYLTIRCQSDDQFGVTLVLQWLPNATLERNPASIQCVSPSTNPKNTLENKQLRNNSISEYDINTSNKADINAQHEVTDLSNSLRLQPNNSSFTMEAGEIEDRKAETISYDFINNTNMEAKIVSNLGECRQTLLDTIPEQFALEHNMIMKSTINVMGCNSMSDDNCEETIITSQQHSNTGSADKNTFNVKTSMTTSTSNARPLFSVNLGKMRSMRIFYSNVECTSGELVIASPDSRYKILHFHYGGLDKLAKLLGHWNAVKSKSVNEGSPTAAPDRQLLICQPAISHTELDPEDGLYSRINVDFWRSYRNADGSIDDPFTVRKAIYFASMDASLRHEIWPFLLRVYPWDSTYDHRISIYNELFLAYQNVKHTRMQKFTAANIVISELSVALISYDNELNVGASSPSRNQLISIASTIAKDVVRTDRQNPYFSDENHRNLATMNAILLNYAIANPEVGYVQGMSDLVAPLLSTLRDESLTYACFSKLMQQTLFSTPPVSELRNLMEINIEYLKELLKLFVPEFYDYLCLLGGDALHLMFVHRWILLFFKREFREIDFLHLWEACWAKYRTSYFHLFVCTAIVFIYGPDIISQRLPNDEILLYFSSLALHMDVNVVLKKARGLLYHFCRMPRLPCTLAGLYELQDATNEQWSSHIPQHVLECVKTHDEHSNQTCPFAVLS